MFPPSLSYIVGLGPLVELPPRKVASLSWLGIFSANSGEILGVAPTLVSPLCDTAFLVEAPGNVTDGAAECVSPPRWEEPLRITLSFYTGGRRNYTRLCANQPLMSPYVPDGPLG